MKLLSYYKNILYNIMINTKSLANSMINLKEKSLNNGEKDKK